ncbi:MAG TPA: dihydrodipicolinate synthase family protein [Fimbriimonadaceae bacterium]|nr:dihydrodipicolinate synthase family protein [Fimbriimonadaceae bacterium]
MQQVLGNLVPLVTPYTDDSSAISEVRLARLVRRVLQAEVGGIIVASDTGEYQALAPSERKELLETVLREVRSDVAVLTNVTADSTIRCLDLAQHASRHGATAAILMPPSQVLSEDELLNHILTVARLGQIPLIMADPESKLTDAVLKELSSHSDISVSTGPNGKPTWSDTFALPRAEASTLHLLSSLRHEADQPAWTEMLDQLGRPQVTKSALELLDMEVGPPRAPARPLTGVKLDQLRRILS